MTFVQYLCPSDTGASKRVDIIFGHFSFFLVLIILFLFLQWKVNVFKYIELERMISGNVGYSKKD